MSSRRISVVVAGEGGSQRSSLRRVLEADGDIDVVAQVEPVLAPRTARTLRPDLLAVDVPPTPGGCEAAMAAIDQVMAYSPVPILVLHRQPGGAETLAREAIAAGALECMSHPPVWGAGSAGVLRRRVRSLCGVTVVRHVRGRLVARPSGEMPVVGIAASTGGPAAVARVLEGLGGLEAAVMVVQHIDRRFVKSFLELLRRSSALPVEIAADGLPLQPGRVYLAPADLHLSLAASRRIELSALPEALHRPSADVLLRSLAVHAGPSGIGVVLTGMGDDGAAGLLALRRGGGSVIAQDAASCAVFGMPRAAQLLGAVDRLTDLAGIATAVLGTLAMMPR
jgi:two-component system, chemotaxis family, protein-glutamate methylesterase/glutaminase